MDRIRSIVVATDFSQLSEAAAARAVSLAELDGAAIHLLHAVRFPLLATSEEISVPAAVWQGIREGARERLEEVRAGLEKLVGRSVTAEVAETSDPSQAISAAVAAHDADLVVMGTHGHSGLKHAFLGSVAERTLRTLERPILAVKEDPARAAQPIKRILVAVDFSVHSDRAIDISAGLARRLSASVDVLHALDLPSAYAPYAAALGIELEQKIHASATERLDAVGVKLEKSGVPVTLECRRGHPSSVIAATAEEIGCQLIVMGRRGISGLPHILLGSVAERTLRAAPCSVLTVKGEEPAS